MLGWIREVGVEYWEAVRLLSVFECRGRIYWGFVYLRSLCLGSGSWKVHEGSLVSLEFMKTIQQRKLLNTKCKKNFVQLCCVLGKWSLFKGIHQILEETTGHVSNILGMAALRRSHPSGNYSGRPAEQEESAVSTKIHLKFDFLGPCVAKQSEMFYLP